MEDTKYSIKIVSARGHDTEVLDNPAAVLTRMDELVKDGKWAYLNGNVVQDMNDVTIDDILNTETITMTNPLVGG